MGSKTLPFPWYGGKYKHLGFILDHLPQTERYVEPFGGSACVLINKEKVPVETYNDIDGEVVNFFEVLQKNKEELLERLEYTPHSRGYFQKAIEEEPEDDVERALFFLVRTAQAYNAIGGSGGWAGSIGVERRGMPQKTSAWDTRRGQVEDTAERFMEVQIECRPATDVISRHDHVDALFYCDPPYPSDTRKSTGQYNHEMSDEEHRELAETLNECDGFVAISSYESDLYADLFDGWYMYRDEEKTLSGSGTGDRQEVLYTNYEVSEVVDDYSGESITEIV